MSIAFDGVWYVVYDRASGSPMGRFTTAAAAAAFMRSER